MRLPDGVAGLLQRESARAPQELDGAQPVAAFQAPAQALVRQVGFRIEGALDRAPAHEDRLQRLLERAADALAAYTPRTEVQAAIARSASQRRPSNCTTPSITVATQCVAYSKGSPS